MKRPERVAAVDKIEEKRKPEDFIGHRKRDFGGKQKNDIEKDPEVLVDFRVVAYVELTSRSYRFP